MNNEKAYITKSDKETRVLGRKLANKLKNGDFLALYGNLGSGKTTFIQGLAQGLGVKRRIISPTFIIIRQYNLEKSTFFHIDLYRTQKPDDILGLGIDQIIASKNSIIALEWAEKLGDFLPKKRIDIKFNYLNENEREIKISKYGQ